MAPVLKTQREIELLRAANAVVAEVLLSIGEMVAPGMTTWDLEEEARRILSKRGARSAFLGYQPAPDMPPYPAVLCTSINEEVVHGIPRKDRVLRAGDIVSVDFGAFKNGYCGDAARTFAVGDVDEESLRLIAATSEGLEKAVDAARVGNRLGDIGHAVQAHVESRGFSVVRDFVGHGIGRRMHEEPQVPNYGHAGRGMRLRPGLVIAIEPMVNMGEPQVEILDDGWTAVTADGRRSAHFEHSLAITKQGPMVLDRL